ncbi:hypothetical protein XENORESO_013099 [Xenotaenia resolanae]|uniref:Uncharacterized protein n=1 Tax=Xenotaenia resolanae TaxID=208358 RepID=A0ABV0VWZ2_9TELE
MQEVKCRGEEMSDVDILKEEEEKERRETEDVVQNLLVTIWSIVTHTLYLVSLKMVDTTECKCMWGAVAGTCMNQLGMILAWPSLKKGGTELIKSHISLHASSFSAF